ncbi:helix-turn-helix domain-containing protein [Kosmotoga sp. DU53]|uniref:helix-turn-helix domain-containing protein n=1 Tax=Kosmotoga sp. DU53 TaxID=1310160 RepID=UPI0007C5588A|nr:helix-turn-helix domain-containing protein [Kosmotoga sp. DU53]OAA19001.1 hypothetical protein DU53_11915 [Kosmotoga sp. DU53]
MFSLEQIWEKLDNFKGAEKKKVFDLIVELLSASNDPKAKELLDDLLLFKDEIFDETPDPLEEIMADTYTKKEAAKIFGISERTIQRMVSRGLLSPVNPGRKPLKFAFTDLKKLFANYTEDKRASLDYTIPEFTSPFFDKYRSLIGAKKISSGRFEDDVYSIQQESEYEIQPGYFKNYSFELGVSL